MKIKMIGNVYLWICLNLLLLVPYSGWGQDFGSTCIRLCNGNYEACILGCIDDTCASHCKEIHSECINGCSPAQPLDFTVMQKEVSPEDQFARAKRNKIHFDNILRWRAPRHRAGIVAYRIYLDRDLQHLALEIPSRDRKRFRAVQRNVNPCKIQKYFLVSVNEFGIESKPVKAKVKMAKHNCSLKKQEHERSSSSFSSSSCRE